MIYSVCISAPPISFSGHSIPSSIIPLPLKSVTIRHARPNCLLQLVIWGNSTAFQGYIEHVCHWHRRIMLQCTGLSPFFEAPVSYTGSGYRLIFWALPRRGIIFNRQLDLEKRWGYTKSVYSVCLLMFSTN